MSDINIHILHDTNANNLRGERACHIDLQIFEYIMCNVFFLRVQRLHGAFIGGNVPTNVESA